MATFPPFVLFNVLKAPTFNKYVDFFQNIYRAFIRLRVSHRLRNSVPAILRDPCREAGLQERTCHQSTNPPFDHCRDIKKKSNAPIVLLIVRGDNSYSSIWVKSSSSGSLDPFVLCKQGFKKTVTFIEMLLRLFVHLPCLKRAWSCLEFLCHSATPSAEAPNSSRGTAGPLSLEGFFGSGNLRATCTSVFDAPSPHTGSSWPLGLKGK